VANTDEGGPKTTTPVGTYPAGASPYDALDMAGNVSEWTSSAWAKYPNDDRQGSQHADSAENRVLRGGSWTYDARTARAVYQDLGQPNIVHGDIGFRLARAAPSS
jgi:serine/threonine-protein kinase